MSMLILDTETKSSADLASVGAYAYTEAPGFELLVFEAVYRDQGTEQELSWSPLEAERPIWFDRLLLDPSCVKVAHNAEFDRVVLSRVLHEQVDQFLDPAEWLDTRAMAANLGLPQGLDALAKALKVPGKIDEGKALIRLFNNEDNISTLRSALLFTEDDLKAQLAECYTEGGRLRPGMRNVRDGLNRMLDIRDKWYRYVRYCRQDVRSLVSCLDAMPAISAAEQEVWVADQRINDRGVLIDLPLVEAAIEAVDEKVDTGSDDLVEWTGLDNPASIPQLSMWLYERGYRTEHSPETREQWEAENQTFKTWQQTRKAELVAGGATPKDAQKQALREAKQAFGARHAIVGLNKDDDIPKLYAQAREKGDELVLKVLDTRSETSASSVKKFTAMRDRASLDGRARGCFQYHQAHTGRWAGKGIQLQNLARIPDKAVPGIAFVADRPKLVKGLSMPELKMVLRACLKAPDVFTVADYSAIEARVVAWLAGQQDTLAAFERGEDIYLATWAAMSGTRYEDYTHSSPERRMGKVLTLGAGYGGGPNALLRVGGDSLWPDDRFLAEWRQDQWSLYARYCAAVDGPGLPEEFTSPLARLARASAGFDLEQRSLVFTTWAGSARKEAQFDYLDHLKKLWRQANDKIVGFWHQLEDAFRAASFRGAPSQVGQHVRVAPIQGGCKILLPSGRALWYRAVHEETVEDEDEMRRELVYRSPRGERVFTHGGKLTENVTQAVARDLLANALVELERRGARVVAHIHDEIVAEGRAPVEEAMLAAPAWASGLPLAVDQVTTERYLGH